MPTANVNGIDLFYEVNVVEVRDATPEELTPLKQCQSCREGTEED